MVSEHRLARAGERIIDQYNAAEVCSKVFPSADGQQRFISALVRLTELGGSIKVGGRRLREMLGCEINDFSQVVTWDTRLLTPHQQARILPLVNILEHYPTDRMTKPDLDFFYWGLALTDIVRIFEEEGFGVSSTEATGEVWVVNVQGENGTASFVDGKISWQTKETWPEYGCTAVFDSTEKEFNLNIWWGRMYIAPVDVRFGPKEEITPEIFAAVARGLLWLVTATDPEGNPLEVPSYYSLQRYTEAVSALPKLLKSMAHDRTIEPLYRSSIRDLALALRIIVLLESEEMAEMAFSPDRQRFYESVATHWISALLAEAGGGGHILDLSTMANLFVPIYQES